MARCQSRVWTTAFVLAVAVVGPRWSGAADAATVCVNPTGASGCLTTLALGVSAANPGDTINVAPATYFEHVTIDKDLSIVGSDAATTIIDGGHTGRVVSIASGVVVTLSRLTIRNGKAPKGQGGPGQSGGGIHNLGTLTLDRVTVTDGEVGHGSSVDEQMAGGSGGGIYS